MIGWPATEVKDPFGQGGVVPGLGYPYESFTSSNSALVIDLKPPVVHQPGPRPFHYPTAGQHIKLSSVDSVNYLAEILWSWQCWINVFLKPLSHHSFRSLGQLLRARSTVRIPPTCQQLRGCGTRKAADIREFSL